MSRWPRIIVHADMDAFFASIEQLDHPELRGRPVLVAHDGPQSVVTTASYEARPYGVGSAMALSVARRRCPHAVVVPPRFERYREVSRKVMEALASFATAIEPLSLDEAFLDATALRGRFTTPGELGRRIKEAVREATGGLTVSVGIPAPSSWPRWPAITATRRPDRGPGGPDGACLAPLPVRKLWGVGPKTAPRLEGLGLRTIGDVACADAALLRSALGSWAESLQLLARGIDPRPVRPRERRKSLSAEETLDADVEGEAAIAPPGGIGASGGGAAGARPALATGSGSSSRPPTFGCSPPGAPGAPHGRPGASRRGGIRAPRRLPPRHARPVDWRRRPRPGRSGGPAAARALRGPPSDRRPMPGPASGIG